MIKYFQFKTKSVDTIKSGVVKQGEIYYREKTSTHAKKTLVERYISKNKNVLITGDGDSGKTKSLMKFWSARASLFPKKTCVLLSSIHPLTSWVETPNLRKWAEKNELDFKMQYQKVEALEQYCNQKKVVLFLDDVHKLSGRKLQVAKSCIANNMVICTALKENRIPPTIRQKILQNKVQRFTLSTKAAYDVSHIFVFGFILMALGMAELAIIASIFTMASKGRLGSNNA